MGRTVSVPAASSTGVSRRCRAERRAAIVLACLLGACASGAETADAVVAVQFQDMVVPSGMKLREGAHESYSREAAGWRMGHFVYFGAIDLAAAANYVRERMPQHNWSKTRDQEEADGGIRLTFDRGVYTADYSFSRSEGLTVMVVDYATDYSRRQP